MKYEYTYRDFAGALKTGLVEASSRTEAFAKVKGQGLNPVSMKEVRQQKNSGNKMHSGNLFRNIVVAALCVATAAFCAWFFLEGENKNPEQVVVPEKKKPVKKPVAPVVMPTSEPVPSPTNALEVPAPKPVKKLTAEEKLAMIEKKILSPCINLLK